MFIGHPYYSRWSTYKIVVMEVILKCNRGTVFETQCTKQIVQEPTTHNGTACNINAFLQFEVPIGRYLRYASARCRDVFVTRSWYLMMKQQLPQHDSLTADVQALSFDDA